MKLANKIMTRKIFVLLIGFLFLMTQQSFGQATKDYVDTTIVQFSGLVLSGSGKDLVPVPFATVSIKGQGRGTYANYKGFFSIVANKGDVVRFSGVGFRTKTYVIPDTLKSSRYSIVQLLTADTINLPETVIFPWPDRNNFKVEFLAMDVTQDLEERAKENLAEKRLAAIRKNTLMDANENADYYLRQQSKSYYHIGQQPPMNIFNPLAWAKFFQAWKNGDFKQDLGDDDE